MNSGPVKVALHKLDGVYAVCRLGPEQPIPDWADGPGFVSISRTEDELSIVCLAGRVPSSVQHAAPWTAFKFAGPFDFAETGIAAAVLQPLAEARIGIFLVSTFDTDYLFLQSGNTERAIGALNAAGHRVLA
jgi:uncharacterized protein